MEESKKADNKSATRYYLHGSYGYCGCEMRETESEIEHDCDWVYVKHEAFKAVLDELEGLKLKHAIELEIKGNEDFDRLMQIVTKNKDLKSENAKLKEENETLRLKLDKAVEQRNSLIVVNGKDLDFVQIPAQFKKTEDQFDAELSDIKAGG